VEAVYVRRVHAISELPETVLQIVPMYRMRAIGGSLYILGAFLMAFNLWKTARCGQLSPSRKRKRLPLENSQRTRKRSMRGVTAGWRRGP